MKKVCYVLRRKMLFYDNPGVRSSPGPERFCRIWSTSRKWRSSSLRPGSELERGACGRFRLVSRLRFGGGAGALEAFQSILGLGKRTLETVLGFPEAVEQEDLLAGTQVFGVEVSLGQFDAGGLCSARRQERPRLPTSYFSGATPARSAHLGNG